MDQIQRLNTKHDRFGLHKFLGITCLFHFLYRYYQIMYNKSSGLDLLLPSDIFLVTLHPLLSVSSLIFNVLKNRNMNHSFIYEEQRYQSIIFTLRAYSAYMCLIFCKYYNLSVDISTILRFICIMIWHPMIDRLSELYKNDKSGTLIRGSEILYESRASRKHYVIQKLTKHGMLFASMSQMFITGTLIYDSHSNLFDIALFNMLPIQVPLFLSTLVKKGIISNTTNNIAYVVLLIMVGSIKTYTYENLLLLLLVCLLRFKFQVNKYILWTSYLIYYLL